MSSKFDTIFFERYIKNECTDAERRAFESALRDSESLRRSFEQMSTYFELTKSVPAEKTSEAFTDNVLRTIRQRKSTKVMLFPAIRGLFSREVLGVLTAVVVLAVIFAPQLRSVSGSFETAISESTPQKAMQETQADYATEESPALLEQGVQSASVANSADHPAQAQRKSVPVEQRTPTPSSAPMTVQNEIVSAPQAVVVLSAPEPTLALEMNIPASEERSFAKGATAEASVKESYKKEVTPGLSAVKSDNLLSKAKSIRVEESMHDLSQSEPEAPKPFPYAKYNATATGSDTLTVRLPSKQLQPFITSWKQAGGSVLSYTTEDSTAIVRCVLFNE